MEKTEGRSAKRKRAERKKQIILIGIIVVLIITILTIIVKAAVDNKTKSVVETIKENIVENNEEQENDIIFVEAEENTIEENIESASEITTEVAENKKKNTSGTRYRLEVNCEQNVVNVYEKDENGEYTNCVKAMLCSVGPATPTSGTYSLKKYAGWEWKGLFGDVYGQYATQITGNILFHSVPYTKKYNNASLEYWEYDKLGTPASMGCVRLTVKNSKWIYDNCAAGTQVMFYSDSNPGPLGKPTEQKISSESGYNNWDPTDPSSENPWRNYSKEEKPASKENQVVENVGNSENINSQNNSEIANNEIVNDESLNNEVTNTENAVNDTIANNEIINSTDTNTVKTNIINNQEN